MQFTIARYVVVCYINTICNLLPSSYTCSGIVSDEADFLFAYSTPDHYVAYRYEDGTPFIKSFVGVLNERLNNEHLEDTLLVVKEKVADEVMKCKGKLYKQMPSVVSQMRDKVWFHK